MFPSTRDEKECHHKSGERYLNPILPAWVGRGKLLG
jgi:hypothetical protein